MREKISLGTFLVTGAIIFTFLALGFIGCSQPQAKKADKGEDLSLEEALKRKDKVEKEIAELQGESRVVNGSGNGNGNKKETEKKRALELLEKEAKAESIREQENKVLSKNYYEEALAWKRKFEFVRAKRLLEKALGLDPTNIRVRDLLREIELILGERSGTVKVLTKELSERLKVKIAEAKVEVRAFFNEGRRLFNQQEYEDALEKFKRALLIATYCPQAISVNGKNIVPEIKNYIKQCKEKGRIRREKIFKQKREAARILAEEERKVNRKRAFLSLKKLHEQALKLFKEEKYVKAEKLANKIIKLASWWKGAQELADSCRKLREISRSQRHSREVIKFREMKIEQWKKMLEDITETQIPYESLLRFPSKEDWEKVCERRLEIFKEKKIAEPREVIAIKNKLETKKISLSFTDAPFKSVIDFIKDVAEINIVIDSKVLAEVAEKKVTLNVKDLKVKSALDILLKFHGLAYTLSQHPGVLLITKPGEVGGDLVTRIHDVRDIVSQPTDFPGANIQLQQYGSGGGAGGAGGGGPGGAIFETGEETAPTFTAQQLVNLIKGSIAPQTWEDPKYSIAITGGQLLVVHKNNTQEEIRGLLSELRAFSGSLVSIQTRFITVTDSFLTDIGVDWRGAGGRREEADAGAVRRKGRPVALDELPTTSVAWAGNDNDGNAVQPMAGFFFQDWKNAGRQLRHDFRGRTEHILDDLITSVLTTQGGFSMQYALLGRPQLNMILRAVRKKERATQVTAPQLCAFNTQRANITLVNQIAYIQDYDVEIAEQAVIYDPVIGTIQDGLVLDVRPIISNDQRTITLELQPTVAELQRPIRSVDILPNSPNDVWLQLPQLNLYSAKTTVRVPDKGTLIIGGLKNTIDVDWQSETPLLSNIPVVGFFFNRRVRAQERKNLIIVITATIIDMKEREKNR